MTVLRVLDRAVWFIAGACALVTIAVGVFYYRQFEATWYTAGPYLYDTGLFNFLVGPESMNLSLPSAINIPSFYYVHIAPLLVPFGSISEALGLKGPQPLEMVLIIGFAGAAAAAFIAVRHYLRDLGLALSILLAAAFALAYAVSGVMASTQSYPHTEILYVPLAILALMLIFHRHKRWAWAVFIMCLLEREDSGLHMACILGAYLFLSAIAERGVPERTRDLTPFIAAGLIYPAVVIFAQGALLPIHSNFARIYSGSPPYAHLSAELLSSRLHLLVQHPQVLLTLAACLAVFVMRPRLTALTGILAAVPWFLVSVTAVADAPGTFTLYYAFPFLVLPVAPFIVMADLPSAKDDYVDHL
jgi:hypothetical protein